MPNTAATSSSASTFTKSVAASTIVECSPLLAADATITASKITFKSSGSTIVAISSDYASAAGANPTFTVFDELWGYRSERLIRLPPWRLSHLIPRMPYPLGVGHIRGPAGLGFQIECRTRPPAPPAPAASQNQRQHRLVLIPLLSSPVREGAKAKPLAGSPALIPIGLVSWSDPRRPPARPAAASARAAGAFPPAYRSGRLESGSYCVIAAERRRCFGRRGCPACGSPPAPFAVCRT